MAASQNPGPPDEWTQQLVTSLRKRRPRIWRVAAFVCLPLIIVGGFLLWLAYPRPAPPRLLVVALDELLTKEETPRLRARLEPQDPTVTEARAGGTELWFFNAGPAQGERQEVKEAANELGEAAPAWSLPLPETQALFLVRHKGDKYRLGSDDRARLFRWPADRKLIVLDVEETLLGGDSEKLRQQPQDVKPPREAVKALKDAKAKEHHVIYLAAQPARALDYRRIRSWVDNLIASGFPEGPILGRRSYAPGLSDAEARLVLLKDLRKRFTGPLVAVVGKAETAEALRRHGITPLLLGDVAGAPEVAHLKSWTELAAWLGK